MNFYLQKNFQYTAKLRQQNTSQQAKIKVGRSLVSVVNRNFQLSI